MKVVRVLTKPEYDVRIGHGLMARVDEFTAHFSRRALLSDEHVAALYQAKLGIGDRTTIEWFVGPHTIYGKGTFAFLHRHLNWPAPK